MGKKLRCLLILPVVLVLHSPFAWAQYAVPHSVFSNGGGVRIGNNIIYDTVGQTAISESSGGSYRIKSGFWCLAEISSTVDVAITSFTVESRDDAILLMWTLGENAIVEGFYIYRAERERGEELTRVNTELISPKVGNEYIDEEVIPGRTYLYQIGAVEEGGGEWRSLVISASLPPKPLTLYQNYPNPFNPTTTISFFLPEPRHVTLTIYDIQGKKVRTLVDAMGKVGKHRLVWDGMNNCEKAVGSGVYYYRLKAGKDVITKKLIVLR